MTMDNKLDNLIGGIVGGLYVAAMVLMFLWSIANQA